MVFTFLETAEPVVTGVPYTLVTFGSASGLDYTDLAAILPPTLVLDASFGGGGNGFNITANSLQVQFAVPEPAGAIALLGGLSILGLRRRSRQTSN